MRGIAALGVLVTVAVLASCGGGQSGNPQPSDVPDDAAALVGDAEISSDELAREVRALRRTQSAPPTGAATGAKPQSRQLNEALERQALAALMLSEALEQEAADRSVEVSDEEVRRRWDSAVAEQFPTRRALRRFLAGQTLASALAQLRRQMLTDAIHMQVAEDAGGGKKGAKALEEFQAEFEKRWQDRAACQEGQAAGPLC